MRVCPLCNAEYEDSIEFCFNDGSPLDAGDDAREDASLEESLGFRADESAEFLPPEATGLTGEFEAASAEGPLDDDDEFGDRDSGVEVVPGGLTSPLDDESIDEMVTDPFSTPVPGVEPDALARPEVDEGAATLAGPSREDDAPPDAESLSPPPDDELSLDRTADELGDEAPGHPIEEDPPADDLPGEDPEGAPADGFESGAVAEALDEPPAEGPPADPVEGAEETPSDAPEAEGTAGPGAGDADGTDEGEEDAAGDDEAAAVPPAPPVADSGPTAHAPRGVTAQGPVSAKETYLDPLYASIPPGERGKRRSKAIWIFGAIAALLLLGVAGWFGIAQLSKRVSASGPAVSAEVDHSPEDRAPNPDHDRPPRDTGHADARAPDDRGEPEDEATPEEVTPEDEVTPEEVTPDPDETEAERLRRERREEREKEAREERRKAREEEREREARERAEREAAEAAGATTPTGDPWSTGSPGTTTTSPSDPADPWSTGTPGNATGRLTVTSTPGGANFSIDGQHRGVTPLTVDVEYGSHRLKVEKPGFTPQERQFDVAAAKVLQDFSLKSSEPEKGKLTVYSNPTGATLFVDGVQRGKTPLTLEMTPGVHTLRVQMDGFPPREETIDLTDLQPGEIRRRTIELQ